MNTASTLTRHVTGIHTEMSTYSTWLSDARNAVSAHTLDGSHNPKFDTLRLFQWIHGFTAVTRDRAGCSSKNNTRHKETNLANKNDNNGWRKKGGTSGGNFRKPWMKPGDTMEGIFCGTSLSASKFGGQNMIASWRDMKTDEQFQTRFSAALQRKAESGEFKDGVAYKIVYVSNETTAKGFTVKTFDVFEQEQEPF